MEPSRGLQSKQMRSAHIAGCQSQHSLQQSSSGCSMLAAATSDTWFPLPHPTKSREPCPTPPSLVHQVRAHPLSAARPCVHVSAHGTRRLLHFIQLGRQLLAFPSMRPRNSKSCIASGTSAGASGLGYSRLSDVAAKSPTFGSKPCSTDSSGPCSVSLKPFLQRRNQLRYGYIDSAGASELGYSQFSNVAANGPSTGRSPGTNSSCRL